MNDFTSFYKKLWLILSTTVSLLFRIVQYRFLLKIFLIISSSQQGTFPFDLGTSSLGILQIFLLFVQVSVNLLTHFHIIKSFCDTHFL